MNLVRVVVARNIRSVVENRLKLGIKKLNSEAIMPSIAHKGDAGLDVYSIEEKLVKAGEIELIGTGIALELPQNTEAQMRPRSGLALKHGITLVNSPGTIDEGYKGEIKLIIINHGKDDFKVKKGMKIAQMVIKPVLQIEVQEIEELNISERGEGGFGSSGN